MITGGEKYGEVQSICLDRAHCCDRDHCQCHSESCFCGRL